MQPSARLQIFRTGTHTSVDGRKLTVTPEMLQEIADSYDPASAEGPLVVGHPQLDHPAYGWVKSLSVDGPVLYAEPHQVEPQFAELVNTGRFKHISACIYQPATPGNPKPGKHYLKHVGFLGAAAPAVKGLRPAQFAEGSDTALEFAAPFGAAGSILGDLFQRLRDRFIETDGVEKADQIIPPWQISSLREMANADASTSPAFAAPSGPAPETNMTDQAALDTLALSLSTRSAELDARDQELKSREAAAARLDAVAFAEQLVTEGKLLPRQKDQVVEILVSLPVELAVSFAEGDATVSRPTRDVLRQILTDMPVRIDFNEKSAATTATDAVAFAAPPGTAVDAARLELHQQAVAYQAAHPGTDYRTAVAAVGG